MKAFILFISFFICCASVQAQELLASNASVSNKSSSGAETDSDKTGDERSDYIKKFAERYKKNFASFNTTKLSLMRYFELELIRHGLPKDLKSLAYMESSLELEVTSSAGARGPWQLMPGTAKDLGLSIDETIDERTDVIKSTSAAINYLKSLYRTYNDWQLAIAAYNAGGGNVNNAIVRSGGSRDILVLESYLPTETKNYVRRFVAATIAWNGTDINGVKPYMLDPVKPTSTENQEVKQSGKEHKLYAKGLASDNINAGYRLDVISDLLAVPINKLKQLNNSFEKDMDTKGSTRLILPKGSMTDFKLLKGKILAESLQRSSKEFE
jgi:membrane-bound lytic murein transglycosylase D